MKGEVKVFSYDGSVLLEASDATLTIYENYIKVDCATYKSKEFPFENEKISTGEIQTYLFSSNVIWKVKVHKEEN